MGCAPSTAAVGTEDHSVVPLPTSTHTTPTGRLPPRGMQHARQMDMVRSFGDHDGSNMTDRSIALTNPLLPSNDVAMNTNLEAPIESPEPYSTSPPATPLLHRTSWQHGVDDLFTCGEEDEWPGFAGIGSGIDRTARRPGTPIPANAIELPALPLIPENTRHQPQRRFQSLYS